MISSEVFSIFATEFNSPQKRQLILAGLILVLVSLIYYNFLLTPELKQKQQLTTQIQQIKTGLNQVKAANIKFIQENSFQSLEVREKALAQLFPRKLGRADLLLMITKAIQQNGLQFEEQSFEESAEQDLIQNLKIRLIVRGEYTNLQQFLNQLNQSPRILLLEKLLLENPSPEKQNPKLRIEMVLSAYKSLELADTEKRL